MLTELIYASTVTKGLQQSNLDDILAASRRNNSRDHISGALLFNSAVFLQLLEGRRDLVSATYNRIAQDSRHERPTILCVRPSERRLFAHWGMDYIGEGIIHRETLFRYATGDAFDPYELSADAARALIVELADAARAQGTS
jgi:hypothetical protein